MLEYGTVLSMHVDLVGFSHCSLFGQYMKGSGVCSLQYDTNQTCIFQIIYIFVPPEDDI